MAIKNNRKLTIKIHLEKYFGDTLKQGLSDSQVPRQKAQFKEKFKYSSLQKNSELICSF